MSLAAPENHKKVEEADKEYLFAMGHSEITWWESMIADTVRFMLKNSDRSNVRLLDIGCGTGKWGIFASEVLSSGGHPNYLIVGFDISKTAVSHANSRRNQSLSHYFLADASQIPLTCDSFNLIIVVAVLHHLKNEEAFQKLIAEVKRLASKNASILFVENTIDNPFKNFLVKSWIKIGSSELHLHGFTSSYLIEMLKSGGFKIVHYKYENLFVVYLCTVLGVFRVTLPKRMITYMYRLEISMIHSGFWKYCATVHLIAKA
jgi:SAM-dependent methyltransferase